MPLFFAVLAALVLSIACAGPARAGDAAALRVLGFSPDGTAFAFEQYTMVYDDDAAFSEFVIVDTRRDSFVKGTPIRVRKEGDDGLDETLAREEAARRAAPLLAERGIGVSGTHIAGQPSMALSEIGIYQMDPGPLATRLDLAGVLGPGARLELSETPFGTAICAGGGGTAMDGPLDVAGLSLGLVRDGRPDLVLQQDRKLPASRRCALHYGIAEAWWLADAAGGGTLAVIIEYADGDDYHAGPNRRFMAVTRRFQADEAN